ncbi:MAG TPA: molybdenum cofactor guanylyltransferase [Anaerolineae bacterium]|nr:molybdenum cofactor guanylyltransferase [Anaerolineae bacterium]HNU05193.1 molybdenum cofactor guanylyltransferase [Anaerolineae bacterium]
METISVIVLAGGASRRMGANKALLPVSDQETLVSRVVANLAVLSDDIVLVSNTPELYADLPVRHTADQFVGAGPLAGLHAGLQAVQRRWAFIAACDMPLIDHRLVRYMVLLTEGYDAVAPRIDQAIEPLHALYSQDCLPAIEARLKDGQRRMISFYPDVRVRYMESREVAIFDREGRSFANANTPEDWERLKTLIGA